MMDYTAADTRPAVFYVGTAELIAHQETSDFTRKIPEGKFLVAQKSENSSENPTGGTHTTREHVRTFFPTFGAKHLAPHWG